MQSANTKKSEQTDVPSRRHAEISLEHCGCCDDVQELVDAWRIIILLKLVVHLQAQHDEIHRKF
jgi:hypothetical protein